MLRTLGIGELRLLRHLVIDPSLKQAALAKDLGVTRSAVNQIWRKLEHDYELGIRSIVDYGKLGMQLVFGWATAEESSKVITKFSRWLKTNSLVTDIAESIMSSTMEPRVYFEAVVPVGDRGVWFQNQLNRFRKRPYNLGIIESVASHVANHMNLGLFDGTRWEFQNEFRFEASIGVAKGYAEVLPVVRTLEQSTPRDAPIDNIIVASVIESNYHATATTVAQKIKKLGFEPPSERTLRRQLARTRKEMALPYVSLKNIGLTQRLIVCVHDVTAGSPIARLLQSQASTFPKAHVVSDSDITVLDLDIPRSADWFKMSQILAQISGDTCEICTFIADNQQCRKGLDSVVSQLASRAPSGKKSHRR